MTVGKSGHGHTSRDEGPDTDGGKRIVVSIQHPADVHFFRHVIDELESRGHTVAVYVRENEVAVDLLDAFDIDHTVLVAEPDSLVKLAVTQLRYEFRLWRAVRRLDPDVMAAVGGVSVSHVATVVGARAVTFTDTEHARLVNGLAMPFADVVCTPDCFRRDVGPKGIRYDGYHELAYLRPNRFEPDPSVLDAAGIAPTDTFVILRVSSWHSSHDIGEGGFADVGHAIRTLEETGARVIVTSEIELGDGLERYAMTVPPERVHHLLYYADLYVGEGATMAAESAVLGTPAIYVNTLKMGYTDELADEYGLLMGFHGEKRHRNGLEAAVDVLEGRVDEDWARKRCRLLADTVDVTAVVVDAIDPLTDRRGEAGRDHSRTVSGPTEATPKRHPATDVHTISDPPGGRNS